MNGSIRVNKQLADVILNMDQVRPSTGRKSGEPSERLLGETDLTQLRCVKYVVLAGNNINIELRLFSTVLVTELSKLVLTSYTCYRPKNRSVKLVRSQVGQIRLSLKRSRVILTSQIL